MTTMNELLAHAGFVRTLAGRLIQDEHSAEDIAQSTWVVALERPPASGIHARSWLARVVGNLTRRISRSEARRRTHEAATKTPESVDCPETEAVTKEAVRIMTDAVLTLKEPYRKTILLRFYEDLSIHEVAVRQKVPTGTVKSRLKRGANLLRERLDAAHGGVRRRWVSALSPLAGLRAIPAGGAAAAAGIGAAVKLKVGLVCAVLLGISVPTVAALGLWPFGSTTPPPDPRGGMLPPFVEAEDPETRSDPRVGKSAIEAPDPAPANPSRLAESAGVASSPAEPHAVVQPSTVVLAKPAGTAVLRFTISGEPVVTSVRLRLHAAADPRNEWKDTSVAAFFEGLRSLCMPLKPVVDRVVQGRMAGPVEVSFEATGLPEGPILIWIEAENRGGHVCHVRLDAGRALDLGTVALEGRTVRITVKDKPVGRPVEGAAVYCVHKIFILGALRRTDARGTLTWPHFAGTAVRVVGKGYAPGVARLKKDEAEVRLVPSRDLRIPASPGTWVFVEGRPQTSTHAVADASGVAQVVSPEGGSMRLVWYYEPSTGRWRAGPLPDEKSSPGSGALEVKVTSGGKPLVAGSLALMFREGKKRILHIAGIQDGVVAFTDLPPMQYEAVLRCGPQIHDNDHEYYLPPFKVKAGKNVRTVALPDARLEVQIVEKGGKPLAFQVVYYRVRSLPGAPAWRYRIQCKGRTDAKGKVTFTSLPPVEGELRTMSGGKRIKIKITPTASRQIVQL